jgi:hypothetical protein
MLSKMNDKDKDVHGKEEEMDDGECGISGGASGDFITGINEIGKTAEKNDVERDLNSSGNGSATTHRKEHHPGHQIVDNNQHLSNC